VRGEILNKKKSFGWMQATRATFYKYREFRDRKKFKNTVKSPTTKITIQL